MGQAQLSAGISSALDPKEFQALASVSVTDNFREGKPTSSSVGHVLLSSLSSFLYTLLLTLIINIACTVLGS